MISETQIRYGSEFALQGSSRWLRRYHWSSRLEIAGRFTR
jgi:hypothetical protein